jgi:quinol monooxygenase YgiN
MPHYAADLPKREPVIWAVRPALPRKTTGSDGVTFRTYSLPALRQSNRRRLPRRWFACEPWGIEMILVTGSILAREEAFDDVLRSCLEHVERSRKEPGCISHDVHVDCQNPMRLFFFEQWADEAALRTHFAVEGSKAFVRSLKGRIVESSGTKIYRAESIQR